MATGSWMGTIQIVGVKESVLQKQFNDYSFEGGRKLARCPTSIDVSTQGRQYDVNTLKQKLLLDRVKNTYGGSLHLRTMHFTSFSRTG